MSKTFFKYSKCGACSRQKAALVVVGKPQYPPHPRAALACTLIFGPKVPRVPVNETLAKKAI